MNEKLIWFHVGLGPFILLIALAFVLFPPRTINYLYGYRTHRSMKSKEAWDFANRFSARYMLVGALLVCLFQLITILWLPLKQSFMASAIFMTVVLISVIPVTERKLKKSGF